MHSNTRDVITFWSSHLGLSINGNETAVNNAIKRHGDGVKGALIFICYRAVVKRLGATGGADLAKALGGALGNILYEVIYERKTLKSIHLWFRTYINELDLDTGTKVRCELQSRWFVSQVLDMIKIATDAKPSPGAAWATKVIETLEKS